MWYQSSFITSHGSQYVFKKYRHSFYFQITFDPLENSAILVDRSDISLFNRLSLKNKWISSLNFIIFWLFRAPIPPIGNASTKEKSDSLLGTLEEFVEPSMKAAFLKTLQYHGINLSMEILNVMLFIFLINCQDLIHFQHWNWRIFCSFRLLLFKILKNWLQFGKPCNISWALQKL